LALPTGPVGSLKLWGSGKTSKIPLRERKTMLSLLTLFHCKEITLFEDWAAGEYAWIFPNAICSGQKY